MDKQFLADFPSNSIHQWLDKIAGDLKGKSLEDITHNNLENLHVNPVYNHENSKLLLNEKSLQDQAKIENNDWHINRDFQPNITQNTDVLAALMAGSTAVSFSGQFEQFSFLNEVELPYIEVFLKPSYNAFNLAGFETYLKEHDTTPDQVNGAVEIDAFSESLLAGNLENLATDNALTEAIRVKKALPNMRTILVNGSKFHDAGSSIAQEIGYALAEGHELLVQLLEKNISIDDAASFFQFELSSGTSYFFEIAKIKVFRALWAKIIEEYNPQYACSANTFIHSRTSRFYHTSKDVYNNLLRDTTSAMAAAIGGANMITVTPFDSALSKQKESLGQRMATNIQLMLKEESGLNKIIDPSAGSYLMNNIINQLAEKAWNYFLAVEKQNGFTKAILEGTVQREIAKQADLQKTALQKQKITVIGVNKYVNDVEEKQEAKPSPLRKNDLALTPFRLTQDFEASNA